MIDRILGALERLSKSFFEREQYSRTWEYQVASATETTWTGRATSTECPQADLVNIPLMPGIAGTGIKPAVGSLVGVTFLNGDPRKPRVVSWDQTVPESVALARGTAAVHRVGDFGSGGTFVAVASPTMTYTGEDGLTWTIAGAVSGAVVNFTVAPVTSASPGKVITKATTGSNIVKSG